MSNRFVIVALIAIAILVVPVAFLLGRRHGPPPADVGVESASAPTQTPPPAAADAASGTASLGDLVAATGDRLTEQADEATMAFTRELEERVRDAAEEADRAARRLSEELDQRFDALQRAAAEQGDLLAERSHAIAAAGRAAAESLTATADELRAQVAGSLTAIDQETEAARTRLLALAGSTGAGIADGGTRIANDVRAGLQRAIAELQATRSDFRQQADAAQQRFTETVAKAQHDAAEQRRKALELVETADATLQTQLATAKKVLSTALERAQAAAAADLARVVDKTDAAHRGRR